MANELKSFDIQAIIKYFKSWFFEEKPENFNLLVIGKTGVGKSRLVNALIDKKRAKEGHTLDPCTPDVTCYRTVIEGVTVNVWDSPGLQDGKSQDDQYIQDMKDNIKNIALMIYCVRMDESKFYDADKKSIQTLTEVFGKEVWNHAVVALTFANKVEDPDGKDNLGYFRFKLEEWKKQLKNIFPQADVGLDQKTRESIPAIPVGNRAKSMQLPGRQNWHSDLWIECFEVLKESSRRGMYRINRHRLKPAKPSSIAQAPAPAPTTAAKPSSAPTTTSDDEVPDEIPLDEKQQGRFLESVSKSFMNESPSLFRGKTSFGSTLVNALRRNFGF